MKHSCLKLKPAVTISMHYRNKELSIFGFIFHKMETFIDAAGLKTTEVSILD
jgi:hypothetical protein